MTNTTLNQIQQMARDQTKEARMTKAEFTKIKQKEWQDSHRTIHITISAWESIVRHVGFMQLHLSRIVSMSEAIEDLAELADKVHSSSDSSLVKTEVVMPKK